MPDPQHYDVKEPQWNAATVTALAADASGQTYYVLAVASSLSGATSSFTIQAAFLGLQLNSVSPQTVGIGGPVTLAIQGGKLSQALIYTLVDSGGNSHVAAAVDVVNSSLVYATFDLTSASAGPCAVTVSNGSSSSVTLPNAVLISYSYGSGEAQDVQYSLVSPSAIRQGRTCQLIVQYHNAGSTDAQAPILELSGDAWFQLPGQTSFTHGEIQLFAGANIGPAGTLPPGYSGSITVLAKADSLNTDSLNVQLSDVPLYELLPEPMEASGGAAMATRKSAMATTYSLPYVEGYLTEPVPIDWRSQYSSLRPDGLSDAGWAAVFNNFVAAVGSDTMGFTTAMDADATYLSGIGVYTSDMNELMALEMEKAGAFGAIQAETTLGAMGYAMPDPTVTAITDASGNVTIARGGVLELFTVQPDGSYLPATGDFSALTQIAGVFQLTQSDRTLEVFNPNGTLNYVQSPNGDRDNYNYTGDLLTSVTDAFSGDTTTYTYDANGRITRSPIHKAALRTLRTTPQTSTCKASRMRQGLRASPTSMNRR